MIDETESKNPEQTPEGSPEEAGTQDATPESSIEGLTNDPLHTETPVLQDFGSENLGEKVASFSDSDDKLSLGMDGDVKAVYNVPVQVSAVLGRASMPVSQLLKLGRGAVVELDRRVGESIDIFVNNRLIARGEIVVVDERLGVTMTEIIKSDS